MATGSGSLQAQNSTLAGVSERQIDVTGALSAQASVVAGAAENIIAGSGALADGSSTVSAVSEREITGSSTLSAQASVVAGVAERKVIVPEHPHGSIRHFGDAEVAGLAEREVAANSGAVQAQLSSITVTANIGRTTSVALESQSSTVTGVAENSVVGSGTLSDSSSTVSGVSEREITGSGTPADGSSSASGTSEREITATSTLSLSSSAVTGVAENEVVAESGAAQAQLSSVSGVAERQGDAEGTPQAQASTVAGATEITANGTGVLSDSSSEVTGASERASTGAGTLSDSSSAVTGVTEREVVSVEADLSADEIGVSAVTGNGEREIVSASGISQVSASTASGVSERQVDVTGTPQAQSSAVTGLAENSIVGSGVLVDGDATLVGVSEREIRSSVTLADGSSTVTGVAENEVPAQSGALQAQASSITVTVEITSNGSGALVDGAVTVAGVAEREITSSGATDTGTVTVSGVSERQIDATGAMETGSSTVDGLAENSIVGSGVLADGDATVSGVSERTIVGVDTALTAAEVGISAVTGEAENIIPGSGVLTTGTVTVAGVAERQIDVTGAMNTGVSSVAGVTEITSNGTGAIEAQSSVTTGLSERTINGSGTLVSQEETVNGLVERVVLPDNITLQCLVTPSLITGVAERTVEIEVDDALNAQSSTIAGVSERTIVLEQGIVNTTDSYYRPSDDDANVDYVGENIEVVGIPYVAGRGIYVKTNARFRVISSGGYRLEEDDNYRIWEQDNGDGTYDIIAYNSPASSWDIWYNQSTSITTKSDNDLLSGTPLDLALSEGIFSPGSSIDAEGTAEREIDTNQDVQALQAGSSSTGIADGLPHNAVPGATIRKTGDQASPAQVAGVAERIIDQDVNDIVVDDALNTTDVSIVVQANVGYLSREDALNAGTTLESFASHASGLSERVVEDNNISASLIPTLNNVVAGVAERIVTVDAGIDMPDDVSEVDGLAERIVTVDAAIEQTQSSAVAGLGERIVENNNITINAVTDQSKIVAQANITYESRLNSTFLGSVLFTQVSTVDGTSEREIRSDAVLRPTTDNLVTGVSERSIVGVDTALAADEVGVSGVTGVGERTVVEADGTTEADPSQIVGVSERTITASGTLVSGDASSTGEVEGIKTGDGTLTTGSVDVTGISEREIYATPELVVGSSTVTGAGEREVEIEVDFELNAQPSTVSGVSERTVVSTFADLHDDAVSIVAAVSERKVIAPETGYFRPTINNVVTGEGEVKKVGSGDLITTSSIVASASERTIEQEGGGAFRPTEYNVVTGVAENKINGSGTLDGLPDHIVAGLAERIVTVDAGIDMPDDVSEVDGLAERIVVLQEGINGLDDESVVDGLAERIITSSGALVDGDATVAGVAERIITVDAGIEQTDESVVSGTVERIITVDAGIDMPDDDSKVVAIAERIITVDAGIDMPDDDSKVAGISERTVTVDEGIEQGDVSKVVADAERIVPSETGAPRAILSYVSGVAERTINLISGIEQVQESTVDGLVERKIDQEGGGVFKPTDNNVITGVAERVITVDAGIDMPDDDSKIVGVSERTIVLQDGIRHFQDATVSGEGIRASVIVRDTVETSPSLVEGLAERTIVQEGDAEFKPTDNNLVEGTAEREIRTSADLVTDGNRVIGTSERISVNLFSDLHTGDAQVTHDPDPITIVRHPIGGTEYPEYRSDLEAFSSHTVALSERKIVQETDGLSTELRFAPNSSDPNVSYGAEKYLYVTGTSHDGTYDMLPNGFTGAVSSGNDLVLTANDDYHVYYRKAGYEDYRVVTFRTTDETWVVYQTSLNPETELGDGVVVPNAQLNGELLASSSQSRGGPYKIMKPTDHNVVVGAAERAVENNAIVQDLVTDVSHVTGTAEREVAPIVAAIQDQTSLVNGLAERTLNNRPVGQSVEAGPSEVVGSGDRHSNAIGVLVSGPSTMGGDAENIIDFEEGISQVDDAIVDGLAERTVVGTGTVDVESSIVSAQIEISKVGSGVVEDQSSTVDGLGVRTSNALEATLLDGESNVSAAAGDGERKVVVAAGDPVQGDNSSVDAEVERCVKGSGNVVSISRVSGVAERHNDAEGTMGSDDHIINGKAERVIVASGAIKSQRCEVVGNASKVMHVVQGIAQVSSSRVEGVSERSITISADLHCTDSKVTAFVYTNNPEQQAMHAQRVFRIRKPSTRKIIVRQTPTNRV